MRIGCLRVRGVRSGSFRGRSSDTNQLVIVIVILDRFKFYLALASGRFWLRLHLWLGFLVRLLISDWRQRVILG